MIYDYADGSSWVAIVAAVLVIEIATILVIRPISENSRVWYNHFGITAVLADIGIILLDFAVSRYAFAAYDTSGYNAWTKASIFSATLLYMQIAHDLIYYHVFMKRLFAASSNGIVVFMRKYGEEGSLWPILGDSIMVVTSGLLAHALSRAASHVVVIVLIAAVYVIPYMIVPAFPPHRSPHRTQHKDATLVCTSPQLQVLRFATVPNMYAIPE